MLPGRALGLLNVIISEGLYDRDFVIQWTNGPFLVRRDTRKLITERDVVADGKDNRWMVWDRARQGVAAVNDPGVEPALEAEGRIGMSDGSEVDFTTVWRLLGERVAHYSPQAVETITWVPAERVRTAARIFATNRPAVIQWGVSFDQQGVNSMHTIQAALILMAITGNLDVPGGMAFWVSGDWIDSFTAEQSLPHLVPQRSLDLADRYGKEVFPMLQKGWAHGSLVDNAVADGELPIQALLNVGANPLVTVENTRRTYDALMKIPFIVSLDLYMNPMIELSDIVLPVTTWMERDQIGDEMHFMWGIFARQRAVDPLGESRSDEEIFIELGERLGMGEFFPWRTLDEYYDWRLHKTGLKWAEFKKVGMLKGPMSYRKFETGFYHSQGGFDTRTGRVELYSTRFASLGVDPLPHFEEPPEETPYNSALADDYPLIAITRRVAAFFHSEFRQVPWLRELESEPIVEINPRTAEELGISDGDWVYIETKRGTIRQRARLTEGVHPRVVCAQHGWWFPEKSVADDLHGVWESNLNVLTRNDRGQGFDPLYGCPQLRGFLCRLRKA